MPNDVLTENRTFIPETLDNMLSFPMVRLSKYFAGSEITSPGTQRSGPILSRTPQTRKR